MPTSTRHARAKRRLAWGRPRKEVSTSVVDIDVVLRDIVFQRRAPVQDRTDGVPLTSGDYAIEGVVFHAATDSGNESDAGPVLVYILGYEQSERMDRDRNLDPRSVCYIDTDRREDFAWHANIYVESFIFGRLVELFASKRIDFVRMSMLLNVLIDMSGTIDVPTFPALRTSDGHSQQSRCQLLSVLTSLGVDPHAHAEVDRRSAVWSARLGRRSVGDVHLDEPADVIRTEFKSVLG